MNRIRLTLAQRIILVLRMGRQGPAGPPGSAGIVWNETPTGTVNGTNAAFTLAAAPSTTAKLLVHVNGLLQRHGASNDFTLTGSTITFNAGAIPQSGDVLLATYSTV